MSMFMHKANDTTTNKNDNDMNICFEKSGEAKWGRCKRGWSVF